MVALAPNTSEPSPWDVLDGFPKLHSRAREAITLNCTEVPYSKSLSRVEIWLLIYECCDGLESFTRDPIGFKGSPWNLFEYVGGRPAVLNDPSGKGWWPWSKCPPPKVVTYTPVPIPPVPTPTAYDAIFWKRRALRFGLKATQCRFLETQVLRTCPGHVYPNRCVEAVLIAARELGCPGM